ncbi:CDF family Co(II)/Ni(II) efflux transporter DmeF [Desulfurispirillum indicum]|uniref:CDF family Co(II)/Ni(II) efflux transporter DmeF n=1 Tax=Desulfurispirillum indicum TaxID=936456 RepID=UPI001CF9C92C|nr:CDF family Co(II)/Ni(II) efflux transporter DmeF [Desulfurispirillum indicum]UCZ55951.1 CDF family Co(II)/Ni(II) efflux transporter DmeF [Desulfurispirillum indicum]
MATHASSAPSMDTCTLVARINSEHDFGQGTKRSAERRTLIVTILTLVTMIGEIAGGWLTGSMALLADGIHMGGHTVALGLATLAYYLARRHAHDRRLSLGSGKIADLAAYTSALFLGASILWLVYESVNRLLNPQSLYAMEALMVAVIGLLVNLVSAWLLAGSHDHHHGHDHDHDHHHGDSHESHHHHQDNNLRAALVHVIADAVTSVAAIVGLLAAWLWGWNWLDPVIALVASLVILRWSFGLLRQTSAVLLDAEGPKQLRNRIRSRLEGVADSRVTDLHLWSVGQGAWTLMASVVSHHPVSPEVYKEQLADMAGIHHPIIEVYYCEECQELPRRR